MGLSCCGFGHRDCNAVLTDRLYTLLHYLSYEYGVTNYLTGGMGTFDSAFCGSVRMLKRKKEGIRLSLIKPYFSNEPNWSKDYYTSCYDHVVVPNCLMGVHPKAAIRLRNRWIIDNSDFIFLYVYRNFGGAYEAFKYAKRVNKTIIELVP